MSIRVGLGFDTHQFEKGRDLILGGVKIEHHKGLKGHSDADVLCHAITDALLGALALGDIGTHFPDDDPAYKNADSIEMLKKVNSLIKKEGYSIVNIDSVVIAEKPKLMPYIGRIQVKIADSLGLNHDQVSVKATTSEKMGYIGREEGINSQAIVLIQKI
ncbi:MAG TPA: 2-C-methyl-D-erythritol 2,4-cyclodiphosphate synthase [Balneolaceae bacterium]|nr:2-C-methyl-D-erythritol 2,4-cyclodiphosphate synthase [Balneolaceae bacterium]